MPLTLLARPGPSHTSPQVERDRLAWQTRLDGLTEERDRELATVTSRYAGIRDLVFPFAVALVVPERA